MEIKQLKHQEDILNSPKSKQIILQFEKLIEELNTKNLPDQTVEIINKQIEDLNSSLLSGNAFKRLLIKKQTQITKLLEKEHKLVPKNYYRNLWMVLGMSAIGLPIGVAFGVSIGNMGLLTIGLPIGMAIGLALGSSMDKKALKEGRQLNIEQEWDLDSRTANKVLLKARLNGFDWALYKVQHSFFN